MRKYIFIFLFGFVFITNAQQFAYADIYKINSGDQEISDIVTDELGNVYITGHFTNSIKISGVTYMGNSSYPTGFIARHAPNGNLLWFKTYSSSDYYIGRSLNYKNGKLYWEVQYEGNLSLGSSWNFSESNFVFSYLLACLDTTGNTVWVLNIPNGYPAQMTPGKPAIDNSGYLYVPVNVYAPYSNSYLSITDTIYCDAGLMKISPSGQFMWLKNYKSNKTGHINSISVDASGGLSACGHFGSFPGQQVPSQIIFGNDTLTAATSASYNTDEFLVKMDTAGNPYWAKSTGDSSLYQRKGLEMDVDSAGNMYVLSFWHLGGSSYGHMFSKTSAAGVLLWEKKIRASQCSMSQDGKGDTWLVIHSSDSAKYDQSSYYVNDGMLVLKADSNGNILWTSGNKQVPKPYYVMHNKITVGANEHVYLGGSFYNHLKLGAYQFYHVGVPSLYWAILNDTAYQHSLGTPVSGSFYADADNDCVRDSAETGIAGATLLVQPQNYYIVSDSMGNFSFNLPAGNYPSPVLLPSSHASVYSLACSGFSPYNLNVNATPVNGLDIPLQHIKCILPVSELGITYPPAYCDDSTCYQLVVHNYGDSTIYNMNVLLKQSASLHFQHSSPMWNSFNPADTSYMFIIPQLLPGQSDTIRWTDSTNCSVLPYPYDGPFTCSADITPDYGCFPADSIFSDHYNEAYYFITIGMGESSAGKELKIFPNPANEIATLQTTQPLHLLEVADVSGRVVWSTQQQTSPVSIPVGNLLPGFYFVRAQFTDSTMGYVRFEIIR